ncbi:MAG: precorrin-6A reductase [Lachnospiraceae bacterium]
MKKIVIFGGTLEGRQLVEALLGSDVQLYVCVATYYAATLLPDNDNVEVLVGKLNEEAMEKLFTDIAPDLCLDSTHPYAVEVTDNIRRACDKTGLSYIRVVREDDPFREMLFDTHNFSDKVWFVDSVEEAANLLCETTGNIFITTGSKELEKYCIIPDYENRCIARVLSTPKVMEKCSGLGFAGKNIIAMQGPFSVEMNTLMLKEKDAKWLVTKCSGNAGGYREKCEAAMALNVNLVVIGRPKEDSLEVKSLSETLAYVRDSFNLSLQKPVIYLVAMGPGSENLLTEEAKRVLESADLLMGAKRVLDIWKGRKHRYISYQKDEIINYIKNNPQYHTIALCYSGDIGFCSGAKNMAQALEGYEVHSVSGISSVTYFLNKIHVPWEDVTLASCHGKKLNVVKLLKENNQVCVLLGGEDSLKELCSQLENTEHEDVRIILGSRLSYEEEEIIEGNITRFKNHEVDSLSIAYFEG